MLTYENHRVFQNIPPINRAQNDFVCTNGVRLCTPIYIDPSTSIRKQLLNGVRQLASQPAKVDIPATQSGIQVVNPCSRQTEIESYIGMSLDVLRGVIFARGGIEAGLLLRLQEVTGVELVSDKDFTAAFKARQDVIKNYTSDYPYHSNAGS